MHGCVCMGCKTRQQREGEHHIRILRTQWAILGLFGPRQLLVIAAAWKAIVPNANNNLVCAHNTRPHLLAWIFRPFCTQFGNGHEVLGPTQNSVHRTEQSKPAASEPGWDGIIPFNESDSIPGCCIFTYAYSSVRTRFM